MVSLLQKSATVIVQGLLSLCALLFIGLIVIQLTLVIGINAISAGAGTDFIAGKINQALAPSGYDVAFDGLYYDPVRGISIHNLSISDNRGQFLTMDRFSLAASFLLSPLQTVELSARGGTLTLERIPVTQDTEESEISEPITPFAAPDIFFRKIILTDLSFDRVVLGKDVAGSVYELSPSLYASITLQDDMTLSATLRPGLPQLAQNLDSPQAIVMDAVFTPATLAFSLNEFSILAKNYSLTARGDGALGENGVVSLATQVRHNDLSILSADAIRSASADVRIKGPLSGPALNIAADIVTGSLKERGLSDIKVSLATENINQGIAGDARIETTYKDDPITVDAFLSYDAPALRITDLEGSAPDIILNGDGIFSTDTALFDGSLTIDAKNLARYSELAGVTLGGSLTAEASFKPSNASAQSADIKATIAKGVAGMISVRDLSAQAFIAALSNPWPQSAKIDASAIEISDKITLKKLSATITEGESENYRLALNGDGAVPIPVSFDGSADFSDLTKPVPDIMDIAFNIKQGASTIRLGGDFTTEAVNLTFSTKNLRGQDIPAQLPSQLSDLRIDLDAAMTGTPAQPRTELNAKLRGLGQGTYQSASIDIKAYHDGQALTATITGQGTGIRKLAADVSTPMELSLLPFVFALDQSSPVNGTMTADIDLSAFAHAR